MAFQGTLLGLGKEFFNILNLLLEGRHFTADLAEKQPKVSLC